MLKILSAIGSALKYAFKFCGRLATAPLHLLAGGGGGDMPSLPCNDEIDAAVAAREAAMDTGQKLASIVQRYAAESVIDDAPAPLPPDLPPALREWCRGLSRDEALDICGARPEAVNAHVQGVFLLPGVRSVQRLPTAHWPKEPSSWTSDSYLEPTPAYAI